MSKTLLGRLITSLTQCIFPPTTQPLRICDFSLDNSTYITFRPSSYAGVVRIITQHTLPVFAVNTSFPSLALSDSESVPLSAARSILSSWSLRSFLPGRLGCTIGKCASLSSRLRSRTCGEVGRDFFGTVFAMLCIYILYLTFLSMPHLPHLPCYCLTCRC